MIRQFCSGDADSCSCLIRECIQADSFYPAALKDAVCQMETPESVAERARLFYLAVYESEGQILGLAGLDLNEVRLLCVSPAHRRRGIGRALMEHIKTMTPALAFADIFVYSAKSAVDFYRACGFIERGPFTFTVLGQALQTVFMTLLLR